MSKPTLAERAAISRSIAASHRRIAAENLDVAERLEREACLLDQGIDPFKQGVDALFDAGPDELREMVARRRAERDEAPRPVE